MIMLVIMVMGALTFLVNSLSKPGMQLDRDKKTSEALAQAKDALLAYAINSENNSSESQPRPGNLPCPDTDAPGTAGYGDEQGSCSAGGATSIGRLPWKSLGIPELLDGDGEPLWYAVSDNFRRYSTNANTLNSDTPGTLDVYSTNGLTLLTSNTDKAVAIVFAPGKIIGSQLRSTTTEKATTSNYLESANNRNNASATGPFIAADKTNTFNDKLIFITAPQLRSAVERRVAGELKSHLNGYYTSWNAYPYAAPFSNPTTAAYTGTAATYYGLYPFGGINGIGTQPTSPAWNAAPSISFSGGISGSMYCSLSSGSWTNSRWRCCSNSACDSSSNTTIPAGVTVTISGRLNNVGLGFWKLHDITDTNQVRVRNSSGTTVLASSILNNVTVTGSLNYADGSTTVVFSAQGKSGGSTLQRIELRDIQYQSAPLPTWFETNNWHEVMYYATSTGFAPGGNHTCPAACLTLDNKAANAVIIASGGPLQNQTHPSGSLSNYLEGNNATPSSTVYENKPLSSNFNDKVLPVAP